MPGWTCQKNRGCTKKERGMFCIRFIKNVIFICMFQYLFPYPCCRCLCTWDIRYFWYFVEKTFLKIILFFIWNFAFPVIIISLVQLLKEAEKRQEKMVDIFGFCKYSTKTAFGRIIAGKLPEGQAEKARKRKKRTAIRKQKQITEVISCQCGAWKTPRKKGAG